MIIRIGENCRADDGRAHAPNAVKADYLAYTKDDPYPVPMCADCLSDGHGESLDETFGPTEDDFDDDGQPKDGNYLIPLAQFT